MTAATLDTQAKLALVVIGGGVWSCAPVSEQPEVTLTNWHVFEVKLPGRAERSRHFSGTNITDRDGRTSSAIDTFDPTTGRGRTESGRAYQLEGNTGFTGDGAYTWNRWKSINSVTDVVDVTAEIKNLLGQK